MTSCCLFDRAVPVEVLVRVLEWLEPYDLCSVAQTCLVRPPLSLVCGKLASELNFCFAAHRLAQVLAAVSSSDCIWRPLGDAGWTSETASATEEQQQRQHDGERGAWKRLYMAWLQPRLSIYARRHAPGSQPAQFKAVLVGDSGR